MEWVGEADRAESVGEEGAPVLHANRAPMEGEVNDRRVGVAVRALGGGTDGVAEGGVMVRKGLPVLGSW
jgi:hypothetical protein